MRLSGADVGSARPFFYFPVDFLELVAQRLRADALAYIRALPSFCLGWTISISLSSM